MNRHRFKECAECGKRIGVYEPAMVLEPGGIRASSMAREPELRESVLPLVHAACAAAVEPRRAPAV